MGLRDSRKGLCVWSAQISREMASPHTRSTPTNQALPRCPSSASGRPCNTTHARTHTCAHTLAHRRASTRTHEQAQVRAQAHAPRACTRPQTDAGSGEGQVGS
jgi:hypothetical protein